MLGGATDDHDIPAVHWQGFVRLAHDVGVRGQRRLTTDTDSCFDLTLLQVAVWSLELIRV